MLANCFLFDELSEFRVLITFILNRGTRKEPDALLLNRDLVGVNPTGYAASFNNVPHCRRARFGVASICDESVL